MLTPREEVLTDKELNAHRDAYRNTIRELHSDNKMARTWSLRFLIWHTEYRTLGHVQELDDKDLTAKPVT